MRIKPTANMTVEEYADAITQQVLKEHIHFLPSTPNKTRMDIYETLCSDRYGHFSAHIEKSFKVGLRMSLKVRIGRHKTEISAGITPASVSHDLKSARRQIALETAVLTFLERVVEILEEVLIYEDLVQILEEVGDEEPEQPRTEDRLIAAKILGATIVDNFEGACVNCGSTVEMERGHALVMDHQDGHISQDLNEGVGFESNRSHTDQVAIYVTCSNCEHNHIIG